MNLLFSFTFTLNYGLSCVCILGKCSLIIALDSFLLFSFSRKKFFICFMNFHFSIVLHKFAFLLCLKKLFLGAYFRCTFPAPFGLLKHFLFLLFLLCYRLSRAICQLSRTWYSSKENKICLIKIFRTNSAKKFWEPLSLFCDLFFWNQKKNQ